MDFNSLPWIEITGVVISLIYLFFSIRSSIWLWPFGLLSALLYCYIYLNNRFYADMGLQAYYVVISIYGWIIWRRGTQDSKTVNQLKIRRVKSREVWWIGLIFLVLWLGLFFVLSGLTDSDVPFGDSFTTAGGIVATWMLARKIIEHWLLWIVIDAVSLGLYFFKELYPTTLLFGVYTLMAMIGYFTWRKEFLAQT